MENIVVWGMGLDILVHQIFVKKSYGFTSRLKCVPRTPNIRLHSTKILLKGR